MVRKRFSSTASVKSNGRSSAELSNGNSRSVSNSQDKSEATKSQNGPKYRNRVQRELNKKQPQMPVRLNKRLRKLEREKHIEAIAPHTVPEHTTTQETLSANWHLLQSALDPYGEPVENEGQQKRRRNSSTNSHKGKKAKIDTDEVESASDYEDAEDNLDAIIKSINIKEDAAIGKAGSKIAWSQNVHPFLLDDDLIVPVTRCSESDVEESESDGEEAVEVDMDQEDDFIASKETMMTKSEKMKERKRVDELSKNAVALDCEMVGIGPAGITSALARVSIVDSKGDVLYDKYVQPPETVTDYRTQYSGIRRGDLKNAPPFGEVQAEVANILKRRLLVGHALHNDMEVLHLTHPAQLTRDTSKYRPFCQHYRRGSPSLKNLGRDFLGVTIQEGEHDSVTDARVAMRLYSMHRVKWERNIQEGTKGGFSKSMLARNQRGGSRRAPPRRRAWNQGKRRIGKGCHSKSRKK